MWVVNSLVVEKGRGKEKVPLDPIEKRAKGKEHRRGSLQNRLSRARMRTRLGEALDADLDVAVRGARQAALRTEEQGAGGQVRKGRLRILQAPQLAQDGASGVLVFPRPEKSERFFLRPINIGRD